jgi:hypothetical protein
MIARLRRVANECPSENHDRRPPDYAVVQFLTRCRRPLTPHSGRGRLVAVGFFANYLRLTGAQHENFPGPSADGRFDERMYGSWQRSGTSR